MCVIMGCCYRSTWGVIYLVVLSKIQTFLSYVRYLAQGLGIGCCEPVSLFCFIYEKTDARGCSVNCQGLNGMLRC